MKSTARKATVKKTVIPTFRLAPESIKALAAAIQPNDKVTPITVVTKPEAGMRFTKMLNSGVALPNDAEKFDAIFDSHTELIWSAKVIKASSWGDAKAKAAEVEIVGVKGRLPECDELLSIVDRSVFKPAADHAFFKFLDLSDWYWSNTVYAADSSYAWSVHFGGGYCSGSLQNGNGLVLAVRSASQ